MLKKFEATVAANKLATESLNSKLEEMHLELRLKEDEIRRLMAAQENLENEKSILQLSSTDFANKLAVSIQEMKNLEGFIHMLAAQLAELDKQNLNFTDKFDQLNSLYNACFKLVQLEKDLAAKCAQKQYDQLHDKFLNMTSEKDALLLVNQELNNKITELQKAQETVMAQLSEECRAAGERIQRLESEAEMLLSKKNETETLVSKLEETIDVLSESSRSSENKVVCNICFLLTKLGLGMLYTYSNPNFFNLEARFIVENFNIRNGKQRYFSEIGDRSKEKS